MKDNESDKEEDDNEEINYDTLQNESLNEDEKVKLKEKQNKRIPLTPKVINAVKRKWVKVSGVMQHVPRINICI